MKRVLVMLLPLVLVMVSCSGVPRPETDTDTLVIGSVVLDFPDGFFDQPPLKIDSGLRLDLLNVTRQKEFTIVTTKGGFFYFLAGGGDRYELVSYAYNVPVQGRGYFYGSGGVHAKFLADSGVVQYIGHYLFTFASPSLSKVTGVGTGWHFNTHSERNDQSADAQAYLQKAAPDSAWLSREMKAEF